MTSKIDVEFCCEAPLMNLDMEQSSEEYEMKEGDTLYFRLRSDDDNKSISLNIIFPDERNEFKEPLVRVWAGLTANFPYRCVFKGTFNELADILSSLGDRDG